jgi:hypothetical protein
VILAFRERYTVTPTLQLRSGRPRAPFDPRPDTEGVALLGVSARGKDLFGLRGFGADLLLNNLFDEDYFDPAPLVPGDYPRPGIRVLGRVSYRF